MSNIKPNMYQASLYVMKWEYHWFHKDGPTDSHLLLPASPVGEGGQEKKFGDRVDIQNAHFTQDQSAVPN